MTAQTALGAEQSAPMSVIPKIIGRIWDDPERIKANIRHAMTLGLPEVQYQPEHGDTLVIVASAPSLRLEEIRQHVGPGYTIACVNGAHHWLIDRGITPDYCVLADSYDGMGAIIGEPNGAVRYYVASQCHPDLFAYLQNSSVVLWHCWAGREFLGCDMTDIVDVDGPKSWIVHGGCTAALRAMNLGYLLGFRKFVIHGLDSSFEEGGPTHVIPNTPCSGDHIQIEYAGRTFTTTPGLAYQAQNFEYLFCCVFNHCRIKVFGDGLIPHMARHLSRLKFGPNA